MRSRGCSRCLLAAEAHQLAGTARLLAILPTLLKASSPASLFCRLRGRFFIFWTSCASGGCRSPRLGKIWIVGCRLCCSASRGVGCCVVEVT